MKRLMRASAAAAFAAVLAGVVSAQPPGDDPPREKKAAPGLSPFGQPRGGFGPPGGGPPPGGPASAGGLPPEKLDPQVEAWVKTLTDKMNDPHDAIRDSARAALVAVGGPALPALKQLATGSDAKAFTARRIVQQIERGPGLPGMGGFGDFGAAGGPPGFPGGPGLNPQPGGDTRRPGGDNPPAPPGGRDGGAGREANAPTPLGRVLSELALSDAQRRQAEQVIEGYATKMREVFEKARNGQVDRAEIRAAFAKLADDATADLKKVLTPEQLRRFETLAPAGRPLFPTPGDAAGAPGRPERGDPNAPARPERGDPNAPDRPRQPRPNPEGGR